MRKIIQNLYPKARGQVLVLTTICLYVLCAHQSLAFVLSARTLDSLNPQSDPVRVFSRGEKGYELFRIPALVKTNDGTLLIFAEARKLASAGDRGDIDLVLKRSTDGGLTWSDLIMLWDQDIQTCGNPVPVVDQASGDIHLLMMLNNKQTFASKSIDNGLTWQQPQEITKSVKPDSWGFYATGPVHGIQIKEGPHRGRLVIPAYANIPVNGVNKHHSFCIYSDDRGGTWTRGGLSPQDNVGECTVVELKEGRLMLNMRSKLPFRSIAYSDDGGTSWKEGWHDTALVDPPCQASLLDFNNAGNHLLFFANPASTKRENVTIRMSSDQGRTWSKRLQVYAGPSAYTDMVMLDQETIGIIFESGIKSPHGHIFFDRVALAEIL